ncbi:MAG TPA: DUF3461 family protein [Motiliproteus sp.]
MDPYPTLNEMGITTYADIVKYSLRQEGQQDVLKIYFRREKGSLLPKSKKFKFGRHVKTIRVDSSREKYEEVSETSPFLLKAIDELHTLVKHEHEMEDIRAKLLDDVEHLERVLKNKLAEIRRDIDRIK